MYFFRKISEGWRSALTKHAPLCKSSSYFDKAFHTELYAHVVCVYMVRFQTVTSLLRLRFEEALPFSHGVATNQVFPHVPRSAYTSLKNLAHRRIRWPHQKSDWHTVDTMIRKYYPLWQVFLLYAHHRLVFTC